MMKKDIDTLLLYSMKKNSTTNMRVIFEMTEGIDGDSLETAVQDAIRRYPYFAKKLVIDEHDNYVFEPNSRPIVVSRTCGDGPVLGSEEANGHYLTVDYDGCRVGFNLIHALSNGQGIVGFALTTLKRYIYLRDGVTLDCPAIRDIDSPLLEHECDPMTELDLSAYPEPIWKGYKEGKLNTYTMLRGYIRCILQRGSVDNYYTISIDEKELLQHVKSNDGSPSTFLSAAMFKAAGKWMPKRYDAVEIGNYVCVANVLGIRGNYRDTSMLVSTRYKRSMAKWPTEKLCTMTRGSLMVQSDESVAADYWQSKLSLLNRVLKADNLKDKRKLVRSDKPYMLRMLPMTATVSYIGSIELGELSPYVRSYAGLVDGEGVITVAALKGHFLITFMQKDKHERWFRAFLSVLDDEGINYTVEGPYDKNLSKGRLCK